MLKTDAATANGRIYPRHVMQKAIDEYKQKFPSRMIVYSGTDADLRKAIGTIEDVKLQGDMVKVDVKFFNTYIEPNKSRLTWTPVGIGKLEKLDNGTYKVYDYSIEHFSLVDESKYD